MHTSAELTLPAPQAVLFDRDGTIVVDVPYNGDPDLVQPMPGAREVLDDLRSRGIRLGVVTNQSGIARGYVTRHQVDAVNARVEELLGPFDVWEVCPHGTSDGCACRKPGPGMVLSASARLDLEPSAVAVIGDIGADMGAAAAAGARAVMVPTDITLEEEVLAAPAVASTLAEAIRTLWAGTP
jgi:D-glycero-D-manno-heptose 1,7-bisphosphate phosphatase